MSPEPQRLPLAPAAARPLPGLAGPLIAIERGSDRAQDSIRRKADSFARLVGTPPHGVMAHSLSSVGSAALNFCAASAESAGYVLVRRATRYRTTPRVFGD